MHYVVWEFVYSSSWTNSFYSDLFLTAEVSIKNFCNNFLACMFFRYKRKPWLQWKPCNNCKICSEGKINFIELFPVIQCFNICNVLFIFRMTLVLLQFQMMLSWKQRNMLLFMTVTQVQWRTKVSHALTLFTKFILETIIIIFEHHQEIQSHTNHKQFINILRIIFHYYISDSPALSCAKLMWDMGSKNSVKVIKGKKFIYNLLQEP